MKAEQFLRLARNNPLTDGGVKTAHLLSEALVAAPQHHEARLLRERLHQMFVPRWHFPMLADKVRNTAYAKAIEAKVQPGDIVLDIGCGAGLTALLAARAGAKHVYACEVQPLIAKAAAQIVKDNGFSDRITILAKASHDLIIGEDLPEPADVVISEIVDNVLLGEGALPTLSHAMIALAKPGARSVPERGALMAQPVESETLADVWRPQEVEGFDLSTFHQFASMAQLTPGDFENMKLRALGPHAPLFSFDFVSPKTSGARVTRNLTCAKRGTVHAVVVSFKMELAPGISLSNDLTSGGHWGRSAFLLDKPRALEIGDRVRISAEHDASELTVSVHDTAAEMRKGSGRVAA